MTSFETGTKNCLWLGFLFVLAGCSSLAPEYYEDTRSPASTSQNFRQQPVWGAKKKQAAEKPLEKAPEKVADKKADEVKPQEAPEMAPVIAAAVPPAIEKMPAVVAASVMATTDQLRVLNYAGSVNPDQAQGWLVNGNTRFVKMKLRADGQNKHDVHRLADAQKPHSVIFSSSDSRVPPEVIFDQKLGEIYVVRNVGMTTQAETLSSIEYAVEYLGVRNIVVMGHNSSGPIRLTMEAQKSGPLGSSNLNLMTNEIQSRIGLVQEPSRRLEKESWTNTQSAADELLKKSGILKLRSDRGDIKIRTALYDMDSGRVTFH